jgi:hypothetical protein
MVGVNTRTSFQTAVKQFEFEFSNKANATVPQYEWFFQVEDTDPNRPYFSAMAYQELGLLQQKTEGSAPAYDQPRELIPETWNYTTYALASMVTEEAQLEDALRFIGKLPGMLVDSENETTEYLVWNTLNQGWAADVLLPDGQPLFSAGHPLGYIPNAAGNGVISSIGLTMSNSLGAAELTPQTLTQAELLFHLLLSDRGLTDHRVPIHLVFHPNLIQQAKEVTGSPLAPNTADNTINTAHGQYQLHAVRYLSSPYAWFLAADPSALGGNGHQLLVGFKWRHRAKTWPDPSTDNENFKTSMRLAWGPGGFRGIVGSQGAPG